jgi:hypothetical protein
VFCRSVLCDPELVAYTNEQFVAWGGSIHHSDAHAVRRCINSGRPWFCSDPSGSTIWIGWDLGLGGLKTLLRCTCYRLAQRFGR